MKLFSLNAEDWRRLQEARLDGGPRLTKELERVGAAYGFNPAEPVEYYFLERGVLATPAAKPEDAIRATVPAPAPPAQERVTCTCGDLTIPNTNHRSPEPCYRLAPAAAERMSEEEFERLEGEYRVSNGCASGAFIREARRAREAEARFEYGYTEAMADLAREKDTVRTQDRLIETERAERDKLRKDLAREKQNVETLTRQKWEERDVYNRVVNERDALAADRISCAACGDDGPHMHSQADCVARLRADLAREKAKVESLDLAWKQERARYRKVEADLAREKERADDNERGLHAVIQQRDQEIRERKCADDERDALAADLARERAEAQRLRDGYAVTNREIAAKDAERDALAAENERLLRENDKGVRCCGGCPDCQAIGASYHHTARALKKAEARVSALEAALREIVNMSDTLAVNDARRIAAAALKGEK